ncbi:MAG: HAD family hydrolase [Chloroflexota bacterium]
MPGVAAVIFDLYKTLIDVQIDERFGPAWEQMARWLAYHGAPVDAAALHRDYQDFARRGIEDSPEQHPDIDVGEWCSAVLSGGRPALSSASARPALPGLPGRLSGQSDLAAELALIFRLYTTRALSLFPAALPTLRALRAGGQVRLAIVSNAQRLFTVPELRSFDLERYFAVIVFSSDLKVGKPDPRPFQRALEQLSVDAGQAVYVGDNLYDDIWGARRVGLRTVWVDRRPKPGLPTPFPAHLERPAPDAVLDGAQFERLPEIIARW